MITTIQVHISEQRTHILTPKCKRLGKAVARKSNKSIAEECMKSQEVRKYVIIQLCVLLRRELKTLCSDSTNSLLRSNLLQEKHEFHWESLVSQLTANAPIFLNILKDLLVLAVLEITEMQLLQHVLLYF